MSDDLSNALIARREALRRRKMLPDPVRRQEATQATLDRFKGKTFSWREGRHCVRLAHAHLRQMGRRPPTLPRIRSLLAAKRALAERGWSGTGDMLDALLPQIPPAMMQLGDIATVEGEAGMDAVFICAGPRRLFGWREDEPGAVVLEVEFSEIAGAWRA